jgi:hypothetical protein
VREPRQALEQLDRRLGQGNAVFVSCLHPDGGNGP